VVEIGIVITQLCIGTHLAKWTAPHKISSFIVQSYHFETTNPTLVKNLVSFWFGLVPMTYYNIKIVFWHQITTLKEKYAR
jgi:mRNA-degrading endonuclease HigB of HigAB toxin-antitoxin module